MKRKISYFVWLLPILASLLAFWPETSFAQASKQIELCNETSYVIKVATALRIGAASQSKGWQKIIPGDCVPSKTLTNGKEQVFVYAQSDDIYSGSVKRFEGNEQFCISFDSEFDIDGRRDCRERGYVATDFTQIDNRVKKPQVTFSDPLDFTPKRAKTAAAQRLLQELGYDIGQIDGLSGKRTINSLYDFQSKNGHRKSTTISKNLLNDLFDKVGVRSKARGLLLCNKTDDLIWAAIGRVQGDGFKTEGWLSIDPQECRRAIKEELTARYYFVYAEAVDSKGNPVIRAGRRQVWTGDFELCTKPTRFIIETRNDCAKRGLDKTGFMKIDTGAKTSWVKNFE